MNSLSKKEQDRPPNDVVDCKCRKLTLWHSRTFTPILTHNQLEPIMASIGFFPIIQGIPKVKQQTMKPSMKDSDNANVELGENAKEGRVPAAGTEPATGAVTGTKPEEVPASGVKQIQWRGYKLGNMNSLTWSNLDLNSRPWPSLPYPRLDGLHLVSYLAFLAALESYVDPCVVVNLFLIRPIEMPYPGLKSIYKYTDNMTLDSELDIGVIYFYRRSTFNEISEGKYAQLRETVGDISCNEALMKHVRKDRTRQIEKDERDDSSDFVFLINKAKNASLG